MSSPVGAIAGADRSHRNVRAREVERAGADFDNGVVADYVSGRDSLSPAEGPSRDRRSAPCHFDRPMGSRHLPGCVVQCMKRHCDVEGGIPRCRRDDSEHRLLDCNQHVRAEAV